MAAKADCVHVHVSDNRETLCGTENGCLSMSIIRKRCVTIKAVCVHVHVSDNRECCVTL